MIYAYGVNWEHLGEKGVLSGLVEVYTENWDSGLSKQSGRSYYMLPSKPQKYSIICGDFNAHHSWWNLDVSNSIRANELVQWLN